MKHLIRVKNLFQNNFKSVKENIFFFLQKVVLKKYSNLIFIHIKMLISTLYILMIRTKPIRLVNLFKKKEKIISQLYVQYNKFINKLKNTVLKHLDD